MELLVQDGVNHLSYNDPFVASLKVEGKEYKSVPLDEKLLKQSDIVLITTDHTQYDYEAIVRAAPLVIDSRNATKKITDPALRSKIVLLGSGMVKK
jgi:UDP-N-acetyl-D-glucosamine dehydrogenase